MVLTRTLLVANDGAGARRAKQSLAESKHEVVHVEDTARALLAIQARTPDVIVIDARVADATGAECCARIRATHPRLEAIVILVVEASEIAAAFAAGADDVCVASGSGFDLDIRLHAAERALARVGARRRSDERLRQAQRMESVARLAGGVAHDFNNMLTPILTYTEILLEDLAADSVSREDVEEIRRAAERASALTQQLLAFSRQQVVHPCPIDLNESIQGMEGLLRRTLGARVELVTKLGANLGPIFVDPNQAQQVVLNLAINARDAMPGGGTLTIETASVELDESYARTHAGATAGKHVMLSATDTGIGMDATTAARAFEPFFATNAARKGASLGLATVHAIAMGCGASVAVVSEVGQGAMFRVYFPRHTIEGVITSRPPGTAIGGDETILLVEDEDLVRGSARSALTRKGYTVIEARDGIEALALFEKHGDLIDVLLTDLVMPGMTGQELVERVTAKRTDIKIVCMSGYTRASVAQGDGIVFLPKPFTVDSLAAAVRRAIQGDGQ